jgi:hypothetical protein
MMFLKALSVWCATPEWEPSVGGFPVLLKDLALLCAVVSSLGDTLK